MSLSLAAGCAPSNFDQRPHDPEFELDAGFDARAAVETEAGFDASRALERDAAPSADADLSDDASVGVDGGQVEDAQVAPLDATRDGSGAAAHDGSSDAAPPSDPPDAKVPPVPVTLTLTISNDVDDAVWVTTTPEDPLNESLHFSSADGSAGYALEVGTDSEACRTGLRFPLTLQRGTTILQASLSLLRVGDESTAEAGGTMRVQVFESTSVAQFDHAHTHQTPSQHAPSGLWSGGSVGGFHVGASDVRTVSPNLALLLQHLLDQPAWQPGGYVGFVISADEMANGAYAQYRDSFSSSAGPVLSVTYLP